MLVQKKRCRHKKLYKMLVHYVHLLVYYVHRTFCTLEHDPLTPDIDHHTEKSFRNLVNLNQILIVITIFR